MPGLSLEQLPLTAEFLHSALNSHQNLPMNLSHLIAYKYNSSAMKHKVLMQSTTQIICFFSPTDYRLALPIKQSCILRFHFEG
ncbi:hypothetical protein LJC58_09920 [Lachnospiraceae bacterium OttesenSCG-928-D06]|nr:hypothetical protein [Lachnospiraceae bacterium OttesenSCG-928-D06]